MCCPSIFHSFITLLEKKYFQQSRVHVIFVSFNEWPLVPLPKLACRNDITPADGSSTGISMVQPLANAFEVPPVMTSLPFRPLLVAVAVATLIGMVFLLVFCSNHGPKPCTVVELAP